LAKSRHRAPPQIWIVSGSTGPAVLLPVALVAG
jgi:hypothetical protein